MTRPIIARTVPTDLRVADDGRTVDGRIVPYNEPTEVVDTNHPDHPGDLVRYVESFAETALDRQIAFIQRKFGGIARYVRFSMDHSTELGRQIGYARSLTTETDGAHAQFRLYDRPDLDHIRSMLTETHDGLSVEFHDYDPIVAGEVVIRRSVNIIGVAATPIPAYAGAGVLAVRAEDMELPDVLATPRLERYREVFGSPAGGV